MEEIAAIDWLDRNNVVLIRIGDGDGVRRDVESMGSLTQATTGRDSERKKKTPCGVFCKWQGHQGLNPGSADLESAALPTELYPLSRIGSIMTSSIRRG